jgi:hypothetical protein
MRRKMWQANAVDNRMFMVGVLLANVFYRDGKKYQGVLGWINSWYVCRPRPNTHDTHTHTHDTHIHTTHTTHTTLTPAHAQLGVGMWVSRWPT